MTFCSEILSGKPLKRYSGKRPQTVWGSGRIIYDNVDDDDDDDDDDENIQISPCRSALKASEDLDKKKRQAVPRCLVPPVFLIAESPIQYRYGMIWTRWTLGCGV